MGSLCLHPALAGDKPLAHLAPVTGSILLALGIQISQSSLSPADSSLTLI